MKEKKTKVEVEELKLTEEEERVTRGKCEASNPGDAILISVQWIRVSLLARESFPARHSPQPKGPRINRPTLISLLLWLD